MQKYHEVLDYLYNQFPQYQQIGKIAYKADLSNITALCEHLGDPHKDLPCIHIAGTNGKGSVAHMLASVFQEAGYNTGIYTSPHLIDFRERIKINGKAISKECVIEFINKHKESFKEISPSFFEWTTALAFYYFKAQKTDINIIETGLGGRLDSTNIINPELCIITTIGLDHQNILGNTIQEIASEKAGIIKENTPVLLGAQIKESLPLIKKIAAKKNAPLHCATPTNIGTDLKGKHQQYNASTANSACQLLKEKYPLSEAHVLDGLQKVIKNTDLRGRWETLQHDPTIIADIGHNQQAFEYLNQQLNSISYNKGYFILGLSDDKDTSGIIELLPKNMEYIVTQPNNPRAKKAEDLALEMNNLSVHSVFNSSKEAYLHVRSMAKNEDLIFIGGSAFLVADIISEFFPS